MAINKKYSYKDFTGQRLTDVPASEFNNSEIVGSCFASQVLDTQVFSSDIVGVSFKGCNLDNVIVPPGNTVDGGCHRKIQIQNDLEDWVVDDSMKPVIPVNPNSYTGIGLSIDPHDIPTDSIRKSVVVAKKQADKQADIDAVIALNGGIAERLGIV